MRHFSPALGTLPYDTWTTIPLTFRSGYKSKAWLDTDPVHTVQADAGGVFGALGTTAETLRRTMA
jgi:hypothetical protein